jgi:hypothetical protein
MKHPSLALIITATLTLPACASLETPYQDHLSRKGLSAPASERFDHCHGYGCRIVTPVALPAQDWKDIEALFTPRPKDPIQERKILAQAIGVFEQKVGKIAGTQDDHYGTFYKIGHDQHDCVDESTNTTIYLSLLEQKGLMTHHKVRAPDVRIPLINYLGRWPHQTAVITEIASGESFAVDSWFHDNGFPAEIAPLKDWKAGWAPQRHKRKPEKTPEKG